MTRNYLTIAVILLLSAIVFFGDKLPGFRRNPEPPEPTVEKIVPGMSPGLAIILDDKVTMTDGTDPSHLKRVCGPIVNIAPEANMEGLRLRFADGRTVTLIGEILINASLPEYFRLLRNAKLPQHFELLVNIKPDQFQRTTLVQVQMVANCDHFK